jgi:hypothetical protein
MILARRLSVPRHRPDYLPAICGLGAFVAVIALVAGAVAQTVAPDTSLFDPASDHGVLDPDVNNEPPPLIRKNVPVFGNPPASGAGKTGFDSTNARRKVQAALQRKKRPQPLPPVVTTQVVPVQAVPAVPVLLPADPITTGSITRPYTPPPPRPKPQREADPYAPLGIRAGSFILKPAVELSGGYDSNPRRSTDGEGSALYIFAPELLAYSDWERHQLRADLRGSYTGYNAASDLNRPYFQSTIDGRFDWTRQTSVNLQSRFLLSTDNPGSPDFQAGVAEPTIFTNVGGSAGVTHRFNRVEIGGKLEIDRTRYQDSLLTDGTESSNEDRAFYEYGLELRGSYEASPGFKPFIALEADSRVHDLAVDRSGFRRDSKGFSPRVGTTFELTRLLTGDFSIGYLTRAYDDPRLAELNGFIADGSLAWAISPLTTATFTARSAAYESTQPDISGVLARDFGVQVEHSFRDWLSGTLKFGFGVDDYVGSSQVDHRLLASAGLTYKFSRMLQLKGEAKREQRTSNELNQDYSANIFMLGLRLQR